MGALATVLDKALEASGVITPTTTSPLTDATLATRDWPTPGVMAKLAANDAREAADDAQKLRRPTDPEIYKLRAKIQRGPGAYVYPKDIFHDGRLVAWTGTTMGTIAGGILADADRQKLSELQVEYDKALASIETVSTTASRKRQQTIIQDLTTKVAAGEAIPTDVVLPTREQISESDRRLRQIGIARLEKVSADARAIAEPIFDRLDKVLQDFAKTREQDDRMEATQFGIEYQASMVWKAVICALLTLRSERLAPGPRSPRSMFAGLAEI